MNGDLVSVYNSIFAQIDTIVDDNNNNIFINRAVWNDQVNRMLSGKGELYDTPSVFVEMQFKNKEINLGQKLNAFDIDLIFHIVMMELDTGDYNYDQNVNIFTYRDFIHKSFMLFFPANCGPTKYIGEKQNYNHGNLYEYLITYRTHFIDTTSYDEPITITASYALTIGLTGSYT